MRPRGARKPADCTENAKRCNPLGHTAARESRKRFGKKGHAAPLSPCVRHADNTNFVFFFPPDQTVSPAKRCVDLHRTKTEVVALGECLRLIAAERPHRSQTIYTLEVRGNATTKCFNILLRYCTITQIPGCHV